MKKKLEIVVESSVFRKLEKIASRQHRNPEQQAALVLTDALRRPAVLDGRGEGARECVN